MKRGKNYENAAKLVTEGEIYTPLQAVRLAKQTSTVKFDASVQVSMRLGVDPRKADQMVRGTVNLPHGTGKTARVLVFATGELAEQARHAGADFAVIFMEMADHANAQPLHAAIQARKQIRPRAIGGRWIGCVMPGHGIQQQRAIFHCPGHGPGSVQALRKGQHASA